MLQGLEAVYTGGRSASELENSVERALTRRDTMGRVLTPKEAFRDLCHQCACFRSRCWPAIVTPACSLTSPCANFLLCRSALC